MKILPRFHPGIARDGGEAGALHFEIEIPGILPYAFQRA